MGTATPVSIAARREADRIQEMIMDEARSIGAGQISTWTHRNTRHFELVFVLDFDLDLERDESDVIINELRLEGYITTTGGDIEPTLTMQTLHPTYQPLLRQRQDLLFELLIRWKHMARFGKSPGTMRSDLTKAMDMARKALEATQKATH